MSDNSSAIANARGWYESICEMVEAVDLANEAEADGALDDARQRIEESLRLIGDLDEYGQPVNARLEYQDWGTPWTEYNPGHHEDAFKTEDYDAFDATLLAFASVFYFGE